jgi:hypothetical protein
MLFGLLFQLFQRNIWTAHGNPPSPDCAKTSIAAPLRLVSGFPASGFTAMPVNPGFPDYYGSSVAIGPLVLFKSKTLRQSPVIANASSSKLGSALAKNMRASFLREGKREWVSLVQEADAVNPRADNMAAKARL